GVVVGQIAPHLLDLALELVPAALPLEAVSCISHVLSLSWLRLHYPIERRRNGWLPNFGTVGQVTRLTRDDVASKAGVEPAYVDHLVDLGLITPAQDDSFSSGDVFRARWIRSLEASGLPLDGMAAAVRDGSLSFNYLDASAFERFGALTEITMQELSEAKGLPMGLLSVIREAVGFPEANPDDLVREEELAIAEAVAFQLEYGFNPTVIERLLRVYGDSLRRITETETDAYRSEVTERLLATGTWGNAQNRHLTWGNAQISGLTPPHPVSSVHVLPR